MTVQEPKRSTLSQPGLIGEPWPGPPYSECSVVLKVGTASSSKTIHIKDVISTTADCWVFDYLTTQDQDSTSYKPLCVAWVITSKGQLAGPSSVVPTVLSCLKSPQRASCQTVNDNNTLNCSDYFFSFSSSFRIMPPRVKILWSQTSLNTQMLQ